MVFIDLFITLMRKNYIIEKLIVAEYDYIIEKLIVAEYEGVQNEYSHSWS